MMQNGHVFISYGRQEPATSFTETLYDELILADLQPWLDRKRLAVPYPYRGGMGRDMASSCPLA